VPTGRPGNITDAADVPDARREFAPANAAVDAVADTAMDPTTSAPVFALPLLEEEIAARALSPPPAKDGKSLASKTAAAEAEVAAPVPDPLAETALPYGSKRRSVEDAGRKPAACEPVPYPPALNESTFVGKPVGPAPDDVAEEEDAGSRRF
jgi:hypothetical protein